jgi:hypothetical protein
VSQKARLNAPRSVVLPHKINNCQIHQLQPTRESNTEGYCDHVHEHVLGRAYCSIRDTCVAKLQSAIPCAIIDYQNLVIDRVTSLSMSCVPLNTSSFGRAHRRPASDAILTASVPKCFRQSSSPVTCTQSRHARDSQTHTHTHTHIDGALCQLQIFVSKKTD